jgi:hypothetical protein
LLRNSRGSIAVEIGEGREKIDEAPAGTFDLVVLDAFSSDWVLAHQMAAGALASIGPGFDLAGHRNPHHLLTSIKFRGFVSQTTTDFRL